MDKFDFSTELAALTAAQFAMTQDAEQEATMVSALSRVLARTVVLVSRGNLEMAEVMLEASVMYMRVEMADSCQHTAEAAAELRAMRPEVN